MNSRRKIHFRKDAFVKKIISAFAIAILGFVFLNMAFLLDALFQGAIDRLIRPFAQGEFNMELSWFPPLKHFFFVLLVFGLFFLAVKSKLNLLLKASLATVPLATAFVTIGIFLHRWPVFSYLSGALFGTGVFLYLKRTKQPWQYYCALLLTGIAMFLVAVTGTDI
ncbi:MAG: hypothetical protein V1820_02440 [archaeon]